MMIKANEHKGFSVIQVLQPCVTFNKLYTHEFFQNNIYKLPASYKSSDKQAAILKTNEWGEKKIPVGLIYKSKELSCEEQIPQIKDKSLVENPAVPRDVTEILKKYS